MEEHSPSISLPPARDAKSQRATESQCARCGEPSEPPICALCIETELQAQTEDRL